MGLRCVGLIILKTGQASRVNSIEEFSGFEEYGWRETGGELIWVAFLEGREKSPETPDGVPWALVSCGCRDVPRVDRVPGRGA